jgi:hypothetical protein
MTKHGAMEETFLGQVRHFFYWEVWQTRLPYLVAYRLSCFTIKYFSPCTSQVECNFPGNMAIIPENILLI